MTLHRPIATAITVCARLRANWLQYRELERQKCLKQSGERYRSSVQQFIVLLLISGLLTIAAFFPAWGTALSDVHRPSGTWIVDRANIISLSNETELNQIIGALHEKNGAQIWVATVADVSIWDSTEEFVTRLYSKWEMEEGDLDNGVLLFISREERDAAIAVGHNIAMALPETELSNILDTRVLPQIRDGNFDRGALAGTGALITALEDEVFTPPLFPIRKYCRSLVRLATHPLWPIAAVWVALVMATLRYLAKQRAQPYRITPTGQSFASWRRASWRSSLIDMIHWLADYRVGPPWPNYVIKFDIVNHYEQPVPRGIWTIFLLFMALSIITTVILRSQVWWALGLFLAWTWGEFGWQAWSQQPSAQKPAAWAITKAATLSFLASLRGGIGLLLVLLLVTLGFAIILLPFVLVAWLGTCALLPRVMGFYRPDFVVQCQTCDDTMKRHAVQSPPGSDDEIYEGWHCATCQPVEKVAISNLHLFSRTNPS